MSITATRKAAIVVEGRPGNALTLAIRGHYISGDAGIEDRLGPLSGAEGAHAPEPEVALESDEELLARFARTRDPDLREELAARYKPMADRLAARYRDRGEQMADLEQVASLGMLKAIDGYDDTRGTVFEAYATPTILGELRRHFRDHRWAIRVPRDLKEALPKIRAAVEDLAGEHGRMPDTSEIADHADLEEEHVVDALQASTAAQTRSLDAPPPGSAPDEAEPLGERIGEHDELIDHTEWGVMLEERLERLSDRDREILYLRFVEDLTQSDIAEEMGISQMQVSRVLSSALETLREPESMHDDESE